MDKTSIIIVVLILLPLLYAGYFYATGNDPLGIGSIQSYFNSGS